MRKKNKFRARFKRETARIFLSRYWTPPSMENTPRSPWSITSFWANDTKDDSSQKGVLEKSTPVRNEACKRFLW